MEPSDQELVKRVAGGEREAFAAIVERHAPSLYRLARSMGKNADDAEDVVQEALLAAYRGIGAFDGRSSLKTWLAKIVIKRSISAWRKDKRHRGVASLDLFRDEEAAARPGSSSGPMQSAVDQRLDLEQVLPRLSPEFRAVFVLREIQGLSYTEIGQALGIPPGTVDSRLYRARAELRKLLAAYRPQ